MNKYFLFLFILIATSSFSQDLTKKQELDEVVISSTKLDIPFSKNFRSIQIIDSEYIINSPSTNISDLLQEISGIDIRRRGVGGVQGDLYIRGGGFDQTLLLVDGMKMDDVQTGHHTLNMIIPLFLVERIEVIKGPAARIFGQNAFNGAINIITKKIDSQSRKIKIKLNELSYGSYDQSNLSISTKITRDKVNSILGFSNNKSDGYRHNTDYKKNNYFIKSVFENGDHPIELITSFTENKFGANGFYASPSATEQYEETQSSLVGLSMSIFSEKLVLKPKIYWRRGQDEYIYIRDNPSVYRNLHITNKISAELSGSYFSNFGITGFGLDMSSYDISSNNLGVHSRKTINLFFDHQFKAFNEKLILSPGISLSYFSDMSWHSFPGLDLGIDVSSNLKFYGNIGRTYRIPTYTDLYYSDKTTIGNENLVPESASSTEIGMKYNKSLLSMSFSYFQRNAKNIIDYVKENEDDLWNARNIGSLKTSGFEFDFKYFFKNKNFMSIGYTNLSDDKYISNINFSRYSINSLNHHLITKLNLNYIKNLTHSLTYKFAERSDGYSYSVLDSKIMYKKRFFLYINNIFDEDYYETNLVPMPGRNILIGFITSID